MTTIGDSMSYPDAKSEAMAMLLTDDPEIWASIQGLFAMLALPPIRVGDGTYRRRIIEAEVTPGRWVEIDGASIDIQRLIVWTGTNGSTVQHVFPRGGPMPKWRMPDSHRNSKHVEEL
jgi:hypothetical protein